MSYPTKEEILSNPPSNIETDIRILAEWKEENYKDWKNKTLNMKWKALEELLQELAKHYSHPCKIEVNDSRNYYDPNTQTINLSDEKPSIISSLHEFGHHLYGESELKACSYSVWMFKTVFPKVFKKIKWEGHMIRKE